MMDYNKIDNTMGGTGVMFNYDELTQKINEIMSLKNIENANANVDEASFSGKNEKAAGLLLKEYALDHLIDPKIAQYHKDGILYTHDLDRYSSGMHNCLIVDFDDLFNNNKGFSTRNGDVRKPNSIQSFFQLVAVVFQCQSQNQFGGVGSAKIDYEAAPYVAKTFTKKYKEALMDLYDLTPDQADDTMKKIEEIGIEIRLGNEKLEEHNTKLYKVAKRHTEESAKQGAESLYHNLNTLESRPGSQVPFTSINFGTDTSAEGRLVTKSLLEASIDGIGKFHRTSIFPISIMKHKKGVNDKPGTPNYDLMQLAIKSLTKRIYPNIVNVDADIWANPTCPEEEGCTMGCRTMLGKDRHGLVGVGGRGNIAPVTMNLVYLGIKNGICLNERNEADIPGFFRDLDALMLDAEKALLDRFEWICKQKAKSGYFMYENGTMKNTIGRKLKPEETVRECMKHNTLAVGYCGLAETCKAMFGHTHAKNKEAYDFALKVVTRINAFAKEAAERNDLNFSCYATPAESTCHTLRNKLVSKYGILPGITDREYITNSHHIPVYEKVSIFKKLELEAPFAKLCNGGFIAYVELESTVVKNQDAIAKIIKHAMDLGITYLAFNFPIDTCLSCGYSGEIDTDECPMCKADKIERLRRVTGYLTTDYHKFNKGKIAEVEDRIKHSKYTDDEELY